jgi:hypothetical protein
MFVLHQTIGKLSEFFLLPVKKNGFQFSRQTALGMKMVTPQQRSFCVLQFAKSQSVITVRRESRR